MSPSADIWESPDIGFTPAQELYVGEFRAWLRQNSLPLAAKLADLTPNGPPINTTPSEMEGLQKSIENDFESLKKAHPALVLLGKFVAYANEVGLGPIPQPRIAHLVSKPLNPFADGVAEALARTQTWLEVERRWIEECADSPPIELVVLSAVLHGGLLHPSALVQLARTLLTAPEEALGLIGNRVSIELQLPWHGVPGAENRRWYPDDQTVALIRRPDEYARTQGLENMDALSDATVERLLLQKIRQRMRSTGIAGALRPQSWKHLLDTVATAARMDIPAVLIEYATRRITSHSLKLDTVQRMFGQPAVQKSEVDTEEQESALPDAGDPQVFTGPSSDKEPDWLAFLRRTFLAGDTHDVQRSLEAKVDELSEASPGHSVTRFALYLLTQRHKDADRFVLRKPLKLRTVKSLTLTVGKRFGCLLGEQDPIALTPENLETAYTLTLENVVEGKNPNRLRGTVACALREFQEFLARHCGASPINVREVLGCSRGLLPVDSTILTLEQYSAAREFLHSNSEHAGEWKDKELRHAAEAMLILGFRCGARRMEAHGLEMEDLTDRCSAWLRIRPTEGRQLKTSNAKRQLPLCESLVPQRELDVLYSWREKRIMEGLSKECPYFFATREVDANGETVERQIPVQKLISLIHRALRNATGDVTVHYHHLRHSFATWNFLRLMLSDLSKPPLLFPDHRETTAWIESGKKFREELYGTGNPTRQHAMAVASLLGHSGPSVSTEHYIHCMDWLLNAFLAQSLLLRVPSTRQAIIASARPASALYKRSRDSAAVPVPVHLIQGHFPNLALAAHDADDVDTLVPAREAAPQDAGASWVRNTWDLLYQSSRSNDPLDSLAEELGLDSASARLIFGRAIKIQNITAPRGRRSKTHWMKNMANNKESAEQDWPVSYPEIPHGKQDRNVIRDWGAKLLMFQRSNPERMRSVLGYYLTHVWKTSNVLLFHDPAKPEDAICYRSFLEEVGVRGNQLRLVFFGQPKSKRNAFRHRWKESLGITWRWKGAVELWKPPYRESAASARWLGLEPCFGSQSDAAGRRGSNGFRFLMVMAAIAFGYAGDE